METLDNTNLVTATGGSRHHHGHAAYSPPFVPYGYAMAAPRWAYAPAYAPAYMPYAPMPAVWAGAWWPRPRR
jgi:hypothetical protein